ncbi:MAG TPA: glycosyltransferase [Vicinamibacterales bacterium]|nr:glycosyltransferase [Vicinamibacterales bacterium]
MHSGALHVMHVLFSLRMGGTELGVVRVANGLDRSRIKTSICSCKPADAAKDRLSSDVPIFEFDRRDGNDPRFVLQLARLLRRTKPDILHTHSWGTLVEGLIAARLAGVRRVVHGEHGTMEMRGRNVMVQRWAWGRVDRVLSVSSRLAERMSSSVEFPRERIRVIRNGIDTTRFTPARRETARRKLGLRDDDVAVGTAGRLVPVKDQATLLAALARLTSEGVRFRAILAGDGPLQSALADQAHAAGIADRVEFLGARADIEDVLAAYDVFVLSSVSEGLSNTILEAMSTGLPVVATRVGGADELVEHEHTGMLVPAGDPMAMTAAIRRLLENAALRHTMGAAGRRRTEAEFSLTRMIAAYEDMYLELAGMRPRSARHEVMPTCVA